MMIRTLAIVLALGIAAASPAVAQQAEQDRALALVDEAIALADEAPELAVVPLMELRDLRSWLGGGAYLDALIGAGHDHRTRPEDLGTLTAYLAWRELHQLGAAEPGAITSAFTVPDDSLGTYVRDLREEFSAFEDGRVGWHAAMHRRMGLVDRWDLVGPFPNDGMTGFDAQLGPERAGYDPDAEWDGKSQPVRWRSLPSVSETGYLDVSALVPPAFSAVAYVVADVTLDDDLDGWLDLAVDGAYRVWIDGEPVGAQRDHLGGFFSRDRVAVELDAGTHQILVKLANETEPMGLHARLLHADGRPADFVVEPAPRPGIEVDPFDDVDAPLTPADRLEPLLASEASGDTLAAAAAAIALLQPDDPSEPWTPFVDAALERDPGAHGLVRLSRVVREHWYAVELLDRARALAPEDPWVALAWIDARHVEMGEEPRESTRAVLDELLAAPVPVGDALLHDAVSRYDAGLYRAWAADVDALAARFGDVPAVLAERRAVSREMHRGDYADRVTESVRRDVRMLGLVPEWYDLMRARGQGDDVLSWLDGAALVLPLSPDVHRLRADIARSEGQLGEATAALDAALALAPGDADLLEMRGRIAVEMGDTAAALEDFRASLALRPQNPVLQDYVARLDVDRVDPFETWRIDDAEILASRVDVEDAGVDYRWLVSQRVVDVYDNGLATTWVQQAAQVHTQTGADFLREIAVGYVPDSESVEFRGVRVYGPDGDLREAFDIDEFGPGGGPAAIYYDVRTRVARVAALGEGDTIVWEYTVADESYRNLFDDYFGDIWFISFGQPVHFARYALMAPAERTFFTNADALSDAEVVHDVDGDRQTLVVERRDVDRIPFERGAPGPSEMYEHLHVSTWDDPNALAAWYWNLVENQLVVSPDISNTVAELIDGVDDRREQVGAIYEYVVRNTRYVGLEFGIHGYRPYRTTECFNRRFGDCKDTASLIKVMLGEAGIEAHLVLVRTRDLGRIGFDPPSLAVFNHAIAYVPEFDLYLDGTAGFSGSAETPSMDQGATALIVLDGEGGRFVEIPYLPASASVTAMDIDIDLTSDEPTGAGVHTMTGSFASPMRRAFESDDQREERYANLLSGDIAGVEIANATWSGITEVEEPVQIAFEFVGGDWAQRTADGWTILPTGAESSLTRQLAGSSERTSPLTLDFTFTMDETYRWRLPAGFDPTERPDATVIESPFGAFALAYDWDGETLTVEVDLSIEVAEVSLDDYPAWRSFVTDVEAALNRPVRFEEAGQ